MKAGKPSWQRSESLALVENDNRVVALNLDHLADPPVVLADTAAEIWRAIDGKRNEDEIAAEVARHFGIGPDSIRADVHAFLAQLAELGLIVRQEEEPWTRS